MARFVAKDCTESKMGTPAYTKDEKMQARYRDLIDTKLKLEKKAA